jgi:hypothetical protein
LGAVTHFQGKAAKRLRREESQAIGDLKWPLNISQYHLKLYKLDNWLV